jgi:hypothetical protein
MPITGFPLKALASLSTVSQHNTVTTVQLLQPDNVTKAPLLHPALQALLFYTFLLQTPLANLHFFICALIFGLTSFGWMRSNTLTNFFG